MGPLRRPRSGDRAAHQDHCSSRVEHAVLRTCGLFSFTRTSVAALPRRLRPQRPDGSLPYISWRGPVGPCSPLDSRGRRALRKETGHDEGPLPLGERGPRCNAALSSLFGGAAPRASGVGVAGPVQARLPAQQAALGPLAGDAQGGPGGPALACGVEEVVFGAFEVGTHVLHDGRSVDAALQGVSSERARPSRSTGRNAGLPTQRRVAHVRLDCGW